MCVKLLFDQNLSFRLVSRLKDSYPDSVHIAAINLDKASDKDVWTYAKEKGFIIVTKDSDFNELCTLYDFPPHIIWLRLRNSRIEVAEKSLLKHKETIYSFIEEAKTGILEING